jgi:hypothetical protein
MRIQFSLKSVFGFILFAGLSLGWWAASRRHDFIEQQHQHLLKEWVQPLEVIDSNYIYFRELPIRYVGLERWKVFIPQGKNYELQCVIYLSSENMSEKERIVARIPMASGHSLFQANWRRDSQGKPQVSIAILGPTPEETATRTAHFPSSFCDFFSRTRGSFQFSRGHEASERFDPLPLVGFVKYDTVFRAAEVKPGGVVSASGGFEICIRDVDYKPLKKP